MSGALLRVRCRGGAFVLSALVLTSCGGGGEGIIVVPPNPVSVSMSPTTATVDIGATTSFSVSISGGSPTPTLSTCSSSNSAVATAATNGSSCVATGVSAGSASITATTTGGQTANAQVTVAAAPPALTAFTLTPPTASVAIGQTVALNATPTGAAGATVTVSYVSGSTAVASVSAAGVVTALSVGTSVITATAQGTGSGLTTASLVRTATITVTADPCVPIAATLPIGRSASVTAGSCPLAGTTRGGGDFYRVTLPTAAAVQVSIAPTGFAPYIAALPVGQSEFIFNSGPTPQIVSARWHLPAGLTELRVGAAAPGGTGNYSLEVQQVSPSVENCAEVNVGGPVNSNQTLQATDCLSAGFFSDEFLLFSSRPCVITMSAGTTGVPMADPFLVVTGDTVAFNDDGGGGTSARIALPSCRSASNNVLRVSASSFAVGDVGTYSINFQFMSPAEADAANAALVTSSALRSATDKGPRASMSRMVEAMRSRDWLSHIGVDTVRRDR